MKMVRTKYKMRPEQRAYLNLLADLEAARIAEENRPRIGPKHPPIILPEKSNPEGY